MKSINYFSFLVFIIIASPIKAQYDTDEPIDSGLPVISDCGFNGDVDGSQVADLPIVTFNTNFIL